MIADHVTADAVSDVRPPMRVRGEARGQVPVWRAPQPLTGRPIRSTQVFHDCLPSAVIGPQRSY